MSTINNSAGDSSHSQVSSGSTMLWRGSWKTVEKSGYQGDIWGGSLCKTCVLMSRDHPSLNSYGRRCLVKRHRLVAEVTYCSFRAKVGNAATQRKKENSTERGIDEQLNKRFPVE